MSIIINHHVCFLVVFFPVTVLDVTSRTSRRKPAVRSCESPRDIPWKLWRSREPQEVGHGGGPVKDGESGGGKRAASSFGASVKKGDSGGCWEISNVWTVCEWRVLSGNLTAIYS